MKKEENITDFPENSDDRRMEIEGENEAAESVRNKNSETVPLSKKVGEMTLSEFFRNIGNLKLKHIGYAAGIIVAGIIIIYIVIPLVCLAATVVWHDFSMSTGKLDTACVYRFWDSDLWYTIPLSLVVFTVVALSINFRYGLLKFLFRLFYFALLIFTLEYWNYAHITNPVPEPADRILGGVCFGIFFILIPVLLLIHKSISSSKN
jgi:hypothetical protein